MIINCCDPDKTGPALEKIHSAMDGLTINDCRFILKQLKHEVKAVARTQTFTPLPEIPPLHPASSLACSGDENTSAPATKREYKGLDAEEVNPHSRVSRIVLTLPSGKECKVDPRNLIIDEDRLGAVLAEVLAEEGVPFYKTRVMQRHVTKVRC